MKLLFVIFGSVLLAQTPLPSPTAGGGGGGGGGGTGNAASVVTTTFSTTPTFTCPSATAGTVTDFVLSTALTANITGSTLSGCTTGQVLNFAFTQDGTGGRTVAMPTGFSDACQVSPILNATTKMSFYWDGTNAKLVAPCSVDIGPSIPKEIAAPASTPNVNNPFIWPDSTSHDLRMKDSTSKIWRMEIELTAGNIRKAGGANTDDSAAAAADIVGLFSGCSGTQYLGADGACHSSGTVPDAFSANIGSDCWFGCAAATGASSAMTQNVLYCAEFLPKATETVSQIFMSWESTGAAKGSVSFYSGDGNTLVAQTTAASVCGGCAQVLTLASAFQFQISTVYVACLSNDTTASNVRWDVFANNGALMNIDASHPRVFTAANASAWSGSTPNFPATLGARTAFAQGQPAMIGVH